MFSVNLGKESFKFSCSHFTILSERTAERLHGHNYQVRVNLGVSELNQNLGFAFDFNAVKPSIRKICDELDERLLIAQKSPFLKLKKNGSQLEVAFNQKFYSFPVEDTATLPIANITTEELSRYICERLFLELKDQPHWTWIKVSVEETRGQSVSYRRNRE